MHGFDNTHVVDEFVQLVGLHNLMSALFINLFAKEIKRLGLDVEFSNSLIIQKPTAKEIMHHDVFGYLMKNSSFLHLDFPFKISLFEKLYETLVTVFQYQKPRSSSKILRYASYFQLSSRCLICDETLCLVFDILIEKLNRKISG